jgi:hypothetical protein
MCECAELAAPYFYWIYPRRLGRFNGADITKGIVAGFVRNSEAVQKLHIRAPRLQPFSGKKA